MHVPRPPSLLDHTHFEAAGANQIATAARNQGIALSAYLK